MKIENVTFDFHVSTDNLREDIGAVVGSWILGGGRCSFYLFEFKVVEIAPESRALQQLKDRGYAEKYRARGEPIDLIGVEFSREQRNVVGFAGERG